jgi:hypothetical protein
MNLSFKNICYTLQLNVFEYIMSWQHKQIHMAYKNTNSMQNNVLFYSGIH